jgi:hypothetical protein
MDLRSVGSLVLALLSATCVQADTESPRALARALCQELIEINTTDSVGNVTVAAAELGGSEKVYGDFELMLTNPGGHSSLQGPLHRR